MKREIVAELVPVDKRKKYLPYHCYVCGRFVTVLSSGTMVGNYGMDWCVTYTCSKCGFMEDGD